MKKEEKGKSPAGYSVTVQIIVYFYRSGWKGVALYNESPTTLAMASSIPWALCAKAKTPTTRVRLWRKWCKVNVGTCYSEEKQQKPDNEQNSCSFSLYWRCASFCVGFSRLIKHGCRSYHVVKWHTTSRTTRLSQFERSLRFSIASKDKFGNKSSTVWE